MPSDSELLDNVRAFVERNKDDDPQTNDFARGWQECIKFLNGILTGESYCG